MTSSTTWSAWAAPGTGPRPRLPPSRSDSPTDPEGLSEHQRSCHRATGDDPAPVLPAPSAAGERRSSTRGGPPARARRPAKRHSGMARRRPRAHCSYRVEGAAAYDGSATLVVPPRGSAAAALAPSAAAIQGRWPGSSTIAVTMRMAAACWPALMSPVALPAFSRLIVVSRVHGPALADVVVGLGVKQELAVQPVIGLAEGDDAFAVDFDGVDGDARELLERPEDPGLEVRRQDVVADHASKIP